MYQQAPTLSVVMFFGILKCVDHDNAAPPKKRQTIECCMCETRDTVWRIKYVLMRASRPPTSYHIVVVVISLSTILLGIRFYTTIPSIINCAPQKRCENFPRPQQHPSHGSPPSLIKCRFPRRCNCIIVYHVRRASGRTTTTV